MIEKSTDAELKEACEYIEAQPKVIRDFWNRIINRLNEAEAGCNELRALLVTAETELTYLWRYGNLKPVEGVNYTGGSHKEVLERVDLFLYQASKGE